MKLGNLVRASLARSVERLDAHAVAASTTDDTEELHQCRVATRRLRSDLRTFGPLLESRWVDDVREELAWAGGVLGAVRDTDVLLESLGRAVTLLANTDRDRGAVLIQLAEGERAQARRVMVEMFGSPRYKALRADLERAAQAPKFATDPTQPARPAATKIVRRACAALDKAVADLEHPAADEHLHRVRIKAKRVRYACDATAPALGKKATRLAAAMADVQDVLGCLNDAVVAEAWLRGAAERAPDAAIVAGMFVAQRAADASRYRDAFEPTWRRASRSKLRAWLR